MSDLATLTKQGEVSIIKLDDGKANAFSFDMLESLNACLADVPKDSGSLVITGREGLFSAGFDLKTLASGDVEAAIKMTKLGFNTLLDLYSFLTWMRSKTLVDVLKYAFYQDSNDTFL